MSSVMNAGAQTIGFSAAGSRPASSADVPGDAHDPFDDVRIGELDDDAVADATGDAERLRAVAGDVHRDLRASLRPRELELLAVPLDRPAVHQILDHHERALELGHLDRLEPDHTPGRVAAADAHEHPAVRDVVQRRVGAREHRRLAGSGVRDAVAELQPARVFSAASVSSGIDSCQRMCESYVQPQSKPCCLGELEQLDEARVRRIGQDGHAEGQRHERPIFRPCVGSL